MTYDPDKIEPEWQNKWRERSAFETTDEPVSPMYILAMFPYPSGSLHMGHVRNYTITDAMARYHRLVGDDVLHPFGWDAFGLPAENAANERDTDPASWTDSCISEMRTELTRMGFGYDWSREIKTATPEYYRWNQWLFKRLYENDLVTYRNAPVNWCPSCQTVLADAQVEEDHCWRCDSVVKSQQKKQWFIKTTEYADELVEALDELDGWPDTVKEQQRNWIGKTEGHSVVFESVDAPSDLRVFTTRLETIEGATFVAISPEHRVAQEAAAAEDAIQEYLNSRSNDDDATAGIKTPFSVENPATGEAVPVYIAEYVEESVGTGAIMAVPAHDERDYAFATEHDIPVTQVVGHEDVPFTDETMMSAGRYKGVEAEIAREKYSAVIDSAERDETYRLNDWLISRQRYWGTPIPMIHCEECGHVPVADDDLPVELPEFVQTTQNPLAEDDGFTQVTCPSCGGQARRETDTMDTFVDSSWYFLRYLSPSSDDLPVEAGAEADWMPVDTYVGGEEHAVTHLLYARFMTRFLAEEGYVETTEPFDTLITQGMVLLDGKKMSKSRGNTVSPQRIIDDYGADTARWFMMGAAAPRNDFDWREDAVEGAHKFLQSIHSVTTETETVNRSSNAADRLIKQVAATTAAEAATAYENGDLHRVEPVCREMMQWVKRYTRTTTPQKDTFETVMTTLLRVIEPIAPHVAQECYGAFNDELLAAEGVWPEPEAEPIPINTIQKTLDDIQAVVESVGTTDGTLEVVAAESWMYEMAAVVRELDETTNPVSAVMQQEQFRKRGDTAASYADQLRTSHVPSVTQKGEMERYKALAAYIMEQYGFDDVLVYPAEQYEKPMRREPKPNEPYLNIAQE